MQTSKYGIPLMADHTSSGEPTGLNSEAPRRIYLFLNHGLEGARMGGSCDGKQTMSADTLTRRKRKRLAQRVVSRPPTDNYEHQSSCLSVSPGFSSCHLPMTLFLFLVRSCHRHLRTLPLPHRCCR